MGISSDNEMKQGNVEVRAGYSMIGSAMRKIDFRELTCQCPSHIRLSAK